MRKNTEICFVDPVKKEKVSIGIVKKLFINELQVLNEISEKRLTATFGCIRFIGTAALCKTAGLDDNMEPPNVLYIDKHKLDEILTEFEIHPQLWRLCHKYLAGNFRLVQVNKADLIQLL